MTLMHYLLMIDFKVDVVKQSNILCSKTVNFEILRIESKTKTTEGYGKFMLKIDG